MTKYLDENGLAYFWTKIKGWLSSHAPVKYFGSNWNVDTNDDYAIVVGNGVDNQNPNDSLVIKHDGDIIVGDHSGGNTTIWHQAKNRLGNAITFMSNDTNSDGDGIMIGNGGATIIGAGEAAQALKTDLNIDPMTEILYLASDGAIEVHANKGQSNYRKFKFADSLDIMGRTYTNGAVPSSVVTDGGVISRDINGETNWQIIQRAYPAGTYGLELEAYDSTHSAWNSLNLFFDQSGKQVITISDPSAWRKALGLGDSNGAFPLTIAQGGSGETGLYTNTTISNVITAASGITITGVYVARWGKAMFLRIAFKRNSSISVPASGNISNIDVGTLKAGFRPHAGWHFTSLGDDNSHGITGWVNYPGGIVVSAFEGTGSAYTIPANTELTLWACYAIS